MADHPSTPVEDIDRICGGTHLDGLARQLVRHGVITVVDPHRATEQEAEIGPMGCRARAPGPAAPSARPGRRLCRPRYRCFGKRADRFWLWTDSFHVANSWRVVGNGCSAPRSSSSRACDARPSDHGTRSLAYFYPGTHKMLTAGRQVARRPVRDDRHANTTGRQPGGCLVRLRGQLFEHARSCRRNLRSVENATAHCPTRGRSTPPTPEVV